MFNFHMGMPRNPCEWHTFDARELLTRKDGAMNAPTGKGRLVQHLRLRWWCGISSRHRARWFFGVTVWEKASGREG